MRSCIDICLSIQSWQINKSAFVFWKWLQGKFPLQFRVTVLFLPYDYQFSISILQVFRYVCIHLGALKRPSYCSAFHTNLVEIIILQLLQFCSQNTVQVCFISYGEFKSKKSKNCNIELKGKCNNIDADFDRALLNLSCS